MIGDVQSEHRSEESAVCRIPVSMPCTKRPCENYLIVRLQPLLRSGAAVVRHRLEVFCEQVLQDQELCTSRFESGIKACPSVRPSAESNSNLQ
jgi:hypothetical protein